MEEKLNIAEILKDKPQGTKLYDLLYNIDVVFIFIPIKWIITGSILRKKVTKGKKTFYVYTITEVLYYSMDKYLTKLFKL